jgi:hypothetical protein
MERVNRNVNAANDTRDWELAGLAEGHPVATTGWRRPTAAMLEGGDLVFEWPEELTFHARAWTAGRVGPLAWDQWRDIRRSLMSMGDPDVFPSRAMLFRFAQLAGASDERIRLFATKYGPLQEQVTIQDWSAPPFLPDRQSLAYWRGLSASFARALDFAAKPVRTLMDDQNLAYLVNGHLWQSAAVDFLAIEAGRPRVLRASGGLYGGLAVELLSAVARVGLRLCEGCGGEVEPGGRRYCRSCRDLGVPAKHRQGRYRANRIEPGDGGGT